MPGGANPIEPTSGTGRLTHQDRGSIAAGPEIVKPHLQPIPDQGSQEPEGVKDASN